MCSRGLGPHNPTDRRMQAGLRLGLWVRGSWMRWAPGPMGHAAHQVARSFRKQANAQHGPMVCLDAISMGPCERLFLPFMLAYVIAPDARRLHFSITSLVIP